MNLLPRAKIKCLLSVLERVHIIEISLRRCMRILLVHRQLSVLQRCPYGEVQLSYFRERTFRQKSMTDQALQNVDFTIFKTRNEYLYSFNKYVQNIAIEKKMGL